MGFKHWKIKEIDKEKVLDVSKELSIPPISVAILFSRGIESKEKIKNFIFPSENSAYSTNWFGIDKFISEINSLIENKKKICVYGDYDADGVTATAVMYEYLKYRGADVCYYIPERDRDGYGLNKDAIDNLKSRKIEAIVTVDNGISAYNEIDYANSIGIKVLVTDHHKIPTVLPNAAAIVDPHIQDEDFSNEKNFAGVGVAFKIIEACEKENKNFDFEKYLDLVALGTIGDSIELNGETRFITDCGLRKIENSSRPGIQSLLKKSNLNGKNLSGTDIAFSLVPKINACGRLNQAQMAIKLLLCEDKALAENICNDVVELNILRKKIEEKIFFEVENYFKNHPESLYANILIAEGENWHHGVLGIVASKITEKYNKPCILMTIDGEFATGSCRSVEGFSIYNLVASCDEFLERFGGHNMAAGFNLKSKNIHDFKDAILKKANESFLPIQNLYIDMCLNPSKISVNIFEDLDFLKPFGNGNPEPIFGIMGACLTSVNPIGQGKHIKLTFKKDNFIFDALYFGKTENDFLYYEGEILDLAIRLSPNIYRGILSVSKSIVDIRLSGYNFIDAINQKRIYEKFKLREELNPQETKFIAINREDTAKIYKYFKINQNNVVRPDIMCKRIFENSLNIAKIYLAIDVLEELNLIKVIRDGDDRKITLNYVTQKSDLNDSEIFREINLLTGDHQNDRGQRL